MISDIISEYEEVDMDEDGEEEEDYEDFIPSPMKRIDNSMLEEIKEENSEAN